jgi:hypothetical protein
MATFLVELSCFVIGLTPSRFNSFNNHLFSKWTTARRAPSGTRRAVVLGDKLAKTVPAGAGVECGVKARRPFPSPAQTRTGGPRQRSLTLLAPRAGERGSKAATRTRALEHFLIDGRATHHVNLKASEKRAE